MPTVPLEELSQYIDKPTDPSGWVLIDQDRINRFADATLDHQFIHIDEEKAAQTPFGATIAHGYLSMSLISHFLSECSVVPDNAVMVLHVDDRVVATHTLTNHGFVLLGVEFAQDFHFVL